LKVWTDGTSEPAIAQVNVLRDNGGSNVVMVPLGPSGAIRLAANGPGVSADLTVVGYLAAAGQAGPGVQAGHQVTLIPARLTPAPISITSSPVTLAAQGVAGVPVGGVHGLLLQVTVSSASSPGALRVYPYSANAPTAPTLRFTPGSPVTTTVALRIGGGGSIRLATDGPRVNCTVEIIGFTTLS
jgi:hypothetical protein